MKSLFALHFRAGWAMDFQFTEEISSIPSTVYASVEKTNGPSRFYLAFNLFVLMSESIIILFRSYINDAKSDFMI